MRELVPQLYDRVRLKTGRVGRLMKQVDTDEFIFMSGDKLNVVSSKDIYMILETKKSS